MTKVDSKDYSTSDGLVIANVAYTITFNVVCKDAAKSRSLNLFAEVPSLKGKQLPVVRSIDGQNYQVSWTEELKKAYSGTYEINVYDEEGFSQLKRAQRKEGKSDVEPMFKLKLNHRGTYEGPWIQTEMFAVILFICLYWFAYSHKSNLTN